MKLNKQTDYALRILIYAASVSDDRLLSIQEVTDIYNLSRNHMMKIVHRMGQLGYLMTLRGKGGGICLGKKPVDINIGQLVRDMENSLNVVDCEDHQCRLVSACELKKILTEAMSEFMAVLDRYTLADLVKNRAELIPLLGLGT
ncbi:HTH-type transcriptional repressor NsrR [invertebrate metagenome]|uniref:HTH-type transcriptional repressor NsrR n=1 Tax=invertebrate metagenome TaxID=1711999 RepID=A0A2H9TAM3_9ZZZZ